MSCSYVANVVYVRQGMCKPTEHMYICYKNSTVSGEKFLLGHMQVRAAMISFDSEPKLKDCVSYSSPTYEVMYIKIYLTSPISYKNSYNSRYPLLLEMVMT